MSPWFTGYIGTRAGFVHNATQEYIPHAQVYAGGHLEFDNYAYIKADAGAGSAIQINTEFGKMFELDNNLSMKTSVGAEYFQSFPKKSYYETVFDEKADIGPTWRPYNIKGYGNIEAVYTRKKFEIGLGLQCGLNHSSKPELKDGQLDENIGKPSGTDVTGKENTGYLAPIFNARVEVATNLHMQMKASTEYGTVGLLYTF